MRTTLPDEQGYYWACLKSTGQWLLAFIDTGINERVLFFEEGRLWCKSLNWDHEEIEEALGEIEWHGPFTCPGGDFGGPTVIADCELHAMAKKENKAMVIQYFDYRYCRDEGHGSSITASGVYSREEAGSLIKKASE